MTSAEKVNGAPAQPTADPRRTAYMKWIAFAAASVVSGLALAFLIVAWRPELIRREAATPLVAPASAPVPTPPTTALLERPPAPAPVAARATYADAVQRAAPAVVNVYTERAVTERVMPSGLDQFFGMDFLPRYRRRIERSLGSGVIVDTQGHIVTNHHVIANADKIRVQVADGRTAVASIVGSDPDTDLAVLRVRLRDLPTMPLGRSDRLQVGDVVLAIGDPLGLSQTVTHGIVSATSRQQLGLATLEDFIQTDAAINFGNSGGALVDTNGELVGINTAIVAKNLGVEGIGFAIPVNMVRGVLSEIIARGRVVRGWIGIVPLDVSDEEAAQVGLAHGGVVVVNLYQQSPALAAGIRPGDLVATIDGQPVHSAQEAMAKIASSTPGVPMTLRGLRGHESFVAKLKVAERPRSR
jgi:serine protease DegS